MVGALPGRERRRARGHAGAATRRGRRRSAAAAAAASAGPRARRRRRRAAGQRASDSDARRDRAGLEPRGSRGAGRAPASTRSRALPATRAARALAALSHRARGLRRPAAVRERLRAGGNRARARARCSTRCSRSSAATAACATSPTARARSTSTSSSTATMRHRRAGLTIPHPRAHERAFVLAPLRRRVARRGDSRAGPAADCSRGRPHRHREARRMKHRYIVVEGPIGCGKTSLAHKLAQRLGAALLLEDPSANPFLRAVLPRHAPLRAAHAALLPLPARGAARGAQAARPLRQARRSPTSRSPRTRSSRASR